MILASSRAPTERWLLLTGERNVEGRLTVAVLRDDDRIHVRPERLSPRAGKRRHVTAATSSDTGHPADA
jgi:hypothetical protein